jgi:rhodanese-related sulfurtransferase
MEQIENRMADVPTGPLVLVCEAGKRAEIVAGWLGDQSDLSVLVGGTRAWRNAGYPVVACAPCRWTLERQVRLIAGLLCWARLY